MRKRLETLACLSLSFVLFDFGLEAIFSLFFSPFAFISSENDNRKAMAHGAGPFFFLSF